MKIEFNNARSLQHTVDNLGIILDAGPLDIVTVEAVAGADSRAVIRGAAGADYVELAIPGATVLEAGEATFYGRELAQAAQAASRSTMTVGRNRSGLPFATFNGCRVTFDDPREIHIGTTLKPIGERAAFDAGDLRAVVDEVLHAMCDDYACRRSLCGVRIELGADMKLIAVATDGQRLATTYSQAKRAELKSPNFAAFLPRVACEFLARVVHLRGTTTTVVKCDNGTHLGLEADGNACYFNTPDTPFPEWRQVMPHESDLKHVATFSAIDGEVVFRAAVHALARREKEEPLEDEIEDEDDAGEDPKYYDVTLFARISRVAGSHEMVVEVSEHDTGKDTKFTAVLQCSDAAETDFASHLNARFVLDYLEHARGMVKMSALLIGNQFGPHVFKCSSKPELYEVIMSCREW